MQTTTNPLAAWLLAEMGQRDWTQTDLANAIGVNRGSIHGWLNLWVVPSRPQRRAIAEGLRVELEVVQAKVRELEDAKAARRQSPAPEEDLVPVPLVGEASAGPGAWNDPVVYLPPSAISGRRRALRVYVRGDCMAPQLLDGDLVWVDTEGSPREGNLVLANTPEGHHVKRLVRDGDRQVLRGNDGQTVEITEGVRILGVVFSMQRAVPV